MKLIKILFVALIVCSQLALSIFAQNVKISVDADGSEFEYLEFIYIKIYIENNTVNDLVIESWDPSPQFQIMLQNSSNDVFQSHITDDRSFAEKTIFTIDPGSKIFWPTRGGSISLWNYYLNGIYGLYLPEDDYTLKIKLQTNMGLIESQPYKFKVISPKNAQAFQLYKEAYDEWRGTKDDTGYIARLEKIGQVAPTSVYNTLALYKLYGRYIWGRKQYEKREELIDKMIEQMITNLPGNRYAAGLALSFLRFYSKRSELEKQKIFQNLLSKTNNPEIQQQINGSLGLYVQKGFRTKTVRVDTLAHPPPPPTRH